MATVSKSTGLQLANEPEYKKTVGDRDLRDVERELQNVGKDKEIRILFCIIPDGGPTYAKIKQLAEINYGVLTQCIKNTTINRKVNDGSTISNILLKVNAKLNGTNHRLLASPILSGYFLVNQLMMNFNVLSKKNVLTRLFFLFFYPLLR